MQAIFDYIQYLSSLYGPTRLMAYGTAFFTTASVVIVSFLLWFTRNEGEEKKAPSVKKVTKKK